MSYVGCVVLSCRPRLRPPERAGDAASTERAALPGAGAGTSAALVCPCREVCNMARHALRCRMRSRCRRDTVTLASAPEAAALLRWLGMRSSALAAGMRQVSEVAFVNVFDEAPVVATVGKPDPVLCTKQHRMQHRSGQSDSANVHVLHTSLPGHFGQNEGLLLLQCTEGGAGSDKSSLCCQRLSNAASKAMSAKRIEDRC